MACFKKDMEQFAGLSSLVDDLSGNMYQLNDIFESYFGHGISDPVMPYADLKEEFEAAMRALNKMVFTANKAKAAKEKELLEKYGE